MFDELLRALRRSRDCSQRTLSERSGVSLRAIGALETGVRKAPYRTTVRRLASALGLSAEERLELESAARCARLRPRTNVDAAAELDPLVARVAALVTSNRLVTLTGFGGIGKTSVARCAAHHLAGAFPDGVHFVDCATLVDEDAVATAIAKASRRSFDDSTALESLVRHLAPCRTLLVLDTCEAASPAVALVVDAIVRTGRGIRILATSRRRLMLSTEAVYRIEVRDAARFMKALAPASVVERARRHVSPEANLEWSYGLLNTAERALLRDLSRFDDGFTHDDIIQTFGDEASIALFGLVEHSFVHFTEREAVGRYRLLPEARGDAARLQLEMETVRPC